MSRNRSTIRPWTVRTNFPMNGFHWKWSPRTTLHREKLSLNWKKSTPFMNSNCVEKSLFRNDSVKYPRKSVKRAKRTTLIAGIASDLIFVIFILFSLSQSTIFDSLSHLVWLGETAARLYGPAGRLHFCLGA